MNVGWFAVGVVVGAVVTLRAVRACLRSDEFSEKLAGMLRDAGFTIGGLDSRR